jgi:hypothetical protein
MQVRCVKGVQGIGLWTQRDFRGYSQSLFLSNTIINQNHCPQMHLELVLDKASSECHNVDRFETKLPMVTS